MPQETSILILDSCDTCRSPMAAALLRRFFEEQGRRDVKISSAGIDAAHGQLPSSQAIEVMAKRGLDISSHRSRKVDLQMATDADLIFVADSTNYRVALTAGFDTSGGAHHHKVHLLLGYPVYDNTKKNSIEDPFGRPVEVYDSCARHIEAALPEMNKRFEQDYPAPGTTASERPTAVIDTEYMHGIRDALVIASKTKLFGIK